MDFPTQPGDRSVMATDLNEKHATRLDFRHGLEIWNMQFPERAHPKILIQLLSWGGVI